jgi:hypothetical protein
MISPYIRHKQRFVYGQSIDFARILRYRIACVMKIVYMFSYSEQWRPGICDIAATPEEEGANLSE